MGFLKKMEKANRPLHIKFNPGFLDTLKWMKHHGYDDAPDNMREQILEHARREDEFFVEVDIIRDELTQETP